MWFRFVRDLILELSDGKDCRKDVQISSEVKIENLAFLEVNMVCRELKKNHVKLG